ncbi:MAG: transporter substrate-binding domain-containing protein [Methanocorpusculum sp.]|nr:transporter substrate-binding domain-containing protein [Methanocorpusculum sp.]
MNKKVITGTILILVALLIICSAGCVDNKPTYKIGVYSNMMPWEYLDENGEIVGIAVDVLKMIADKQNVNFEFVVNEAEWEEALLNGTIDAKNSLVKTPERLEKFAFSSTPFAETRYGAIGLDGSEVTLEDVLAGKAKVAVNKNSAYDAWAKAYFGDKYESMVADGTIIILGAQVDQCALAVLSHKADAAVAGDISLSNMLNEYPSLKFLGYIGKPVYSGVAVRKDDTTLLNILNEGVEKIMNTDELNALIKEYNLQFKKDTYVVGIDGLNAPWSYKGADGNYTGYDIEQIEWIADYNGFDVKYKVYEWDNNINAIVNNNIDMWASSMAITPERMQHVAFSDPYYSSGIGVLVRPTSTLTKSDFGSDDAKIVITFGTSYVDWLKSYLGKEKYNKKIADGSIIMADNFDECRELLYSQKVDFFVEGTKQIETEAEAGRAKVLFEENDIEEFGIATSNGNIVLQDLINKGLAEFEKSGKKAELLKKYYL